MLRGCLQRSWRNAALLLSAQLLCLRCLLLSALTWLQ